jgi:BlaI family transcriptional regulator, penicillinase repressor
MGKDAGTVTATELSILDVLWQRGRATVREIVEAIYGEHRQSLHAGTKSMVERLMEKGYVTREEKGFSHVFSAKVDRDTFVGQELQRLADNHYSGALTPMLLAIVDKVHLSRKDRDTLRRIIEGIHD